MKLDVSFKIVNPEFNQEYADQYNWGEEGPGNMKYHETWKYRIEDVEEFSQTPEAEFTIKAVDKEGKEHLFPIGNTFKLQARMKEGHLEEYHVSKELIRNTHQTKAKNGPSRFYFYLLPLEGFFIVNKTSYILSKDIPDELKNGDWQSITSANEVRSKIIGKSGTMPIMR